MVTPPVQSSKAELAEVKDTADGGERKEEEDKN